MIGRNSALLRPKVGVPTMTSWLLVRRNRKAWERGHPHDKGRDPQLLTQIG